ncbi:MAG: 4'-phosphopantetheinyl transferase superfamily protein [Bacteroidota bacterium]
MKGRGSVTASRGRQYVLPVTPFPPVSIRLLGPQDARPEVLSPEETARLVTFAHEARRAGFILGRTAARTLLAESLGCSPEVVPLHVAADGAPVVPGADVQVSIAHAGAEAGGAAVSRVAVGLDLEPIRSRHPDLWRRILAPEEHALLDALGGPTDETQTLLWSLKEAVLKARRTGLRAGTRSVRLLRLGAEAGEATDTDGGAWALGFERRGDVWVTWALRDDTVSWR